MADIIDTLVGVARGDRMDLLRAARPQARENAQRSFELLLEPSEPGSFPLADRYAVATYTVGLQASESPAFTFYSELLEDETSPQLASDVVAMAKKDRRPGPYGSYREPRHASESEPGPTVRYLTGIRPGSISERLAAALEQAHLLSLHPRDAGPEHLRRLEGAGWSADDIVTLSQLIAFLSFQIRVVDGLLALSKETPE